MRIEKTVSGYTSKIVISLMLVMVLALSFPGCAKSKPEPSSSTATPASPEECIKDENRVFYYYEAVVATVGGNEHTAYELYKYTDTELVLVKYRNYPDGDKTMDYCVVSSSVLDDCMKIVKKYKMGKGKWVNGDGIVGMEFAIGFYKNDEYVRVTSDHMPDNGTDAFDAVCNVLAKAWSQK